MKSPRKAAKSSKTLLQPKEFSETLKKYITIAKELDALYAEASKKKNKNQVVKNGVTYKTGELKVAKTKNYSVLLSLAKSNYSKTFRRVRPDRVASVNGALIQPVLVGDTLRNFFNVADLGDAAGRNGTAGPLVNILRSRGFLRPDSNVASGAILTSLLVLYAKRHNLTARARDNVGKPLDLQNGQLLGVDDVMNTQLGAILSQLEQRSAAKLASEGKADGQRKPEKTPKGKQRKFTDDNGQPIWNDHEHVFNRNNFAYGNLQSIYRADIVKLNGKDPASNNANALIQDPALGRAYMSLVNTWAEQGLLGGAGYDYDTAANMAAQSVGLTAVPGELQIRAALDRLHDEIKLASQTYTGAPRKARPKKKKVVAAQ